MTPDDDNTWTLQNILQMKSWSNKDYSKLFIKKIYHDGQSVTTLEKIIRGNTFVNKENIDTLSSAMYMAFGCEYSNNLVKILRKTTENYVSLEEINAVVLKIISVILDLIEIVPNVVSHEPGFLTTSLELNVRLNETIQLIRKQKLDKNDIVKNNFIRRKIWHMVYSIERFITSRCPLDEDFVNEMFLEKSSVNEPIEFIKNMDNILENTGLNTTIILEFKTDDEHQKSYENFIIVITEVINELKPIMKIKNSIFENIENIENDFSDILSYMHFVFDSIMQIMYEQTVATLKSIEKCQSEKNIDALKKLINKWSKIDLITTYERLISQSNLMQFPIIFTIHLELNLRIIKDVMYYKKIHNLKFLKKQIKERSNVLKDKYRRGLELMPRIKVPNEDLWEILSKIVSIRGFKYFNLIFKLQQIYGPVENDSVEMELNKMEYLNTEENIDPQQCKTVQSLYVNCFRINTFITEFQSDPRKAADLTQTFCRFLNATKIMGTSIPSDRSDENFKTIQQMLYRYLMGNNVNFEVDVIRLQKIAFFTMNLLDIYQIHSCQSPVHRSVIYTKYKKNLSQADDQLSIYGKNADKCPEKPDPNEHVEVKQMFAKLQNDYIELDFDNSNPTPLFYWRGELKNFKQISDDVKLHNAFDFSSFVKYVNLTHKWIVSVLFYTMIDVLKYFLKDSPHVRINNKLLTAYVRNLSTINFPTYFLPVINTIRKAENFYEPVDIIGYQILLEDHVKQYSRFQEKTNLSNNMTVYKERLKHLYSRLMVEYDEIYMQARINTAIESKTSKSTVAGVNNNSKSTKTNNVAKKEKSWVKRMFAWGKK